MIKLVHLDENVIVNGVCLQKGEKVPVLSEDINSDSEIDITAILMGMMSSLGADPFCSDNNRYREILLKDSELISKLKAGSANLIRDKKWEKSLELLMPLRALEPTEEVYLTLISSFAQAIAGEELEEKSQNLNDRFFDLLLEAHKTLPNSLQILLEIAGQHYREENWEKALEYFNEFLNKENTTERAEKTKLLVEACKKHIQYEEDVLSVHDLIVMDKIDEAVKKAEALVKQYGENAQLLMLWGWALRNAEIYDEAKDKLLKSLKYSSALSETYNELALCEWEIGSKDLAIEYEKIATDIDPKAITFALNLAQMALLNSNPEDAYNALINASKIDSSDEGFLHLVGAWEKYTKEKFPDLNNIIVNKDATGEYTSKESSCKHSHKKEDESSCGCACSSHSSSCSCGEKKHTEKKISKTPPKKQIAKRKGGNK